MKRTWFLFFAASVLLFGVLKFRNVPPNTHYFFGRITVEKVDFIIEQLEPGDALRINSGGGLTRAALTLAEYIQNNDIVVIIDKRCLSACAEIIMAATRRMSIEPHSLIGFHGNPLLYNDFYVEHDRRKRHFCHEEQIRRISDLYSRTHLDVTFWKAQKAQLKPHAIYFTEDDSRCGRVHYSFARAKFWYPSSETLRRTPGFEIDVPLCNDSLECMEREIARRWPKREFYIIGDDRYVFEGTLRPSPK